MSIETHLDLDLGSSLIEKKIITQKQLNDATTEYRIKGGYFSQHLIRLGSIKDSDLTTFLTCQYGYCYLPLKSYTISDEILESIPAKFACDFCILPIEKNDKLLTISMADPLNRAVIEILRQVSHCEIVVFVSTRSEIKEAIEKYYKIKYQDFELDRFKDENTLRDDIKNPYISNGLYTGQNHRRYQRLYANLLGDYHLYPNAFKTRIQNISLSGILFESTIALPTGMHLAMNIHLDKTRFITVALEVTRCEAKNFVENNENHTIYEIGSFFNFISEENQTMLVDFLRRKFAS